MTTAARLRGRLGPVTPRLPPDPTERLASLAARAHRSGAKMLEVAIDEQLDSRHREPEPPVRHGALRPAMSMVARA